MNLPKVKIIFFCLVLLLGELVSVSPALAANEAILLFEPETATVKKGENLTVKIKVDTGGKKSGGVGAFVNYPTDKLSLVDANNTGSKFDFLKKETSAGSVKLNVATTNGTGVEGEDELVGTIIFKAEAVGTATLTFAASSSVLDNSSTPVEILDKTDLAEETGTYTIAENTAAQTHLECQSNVCVSVTGAGSNTGGCTVAGVACNLSGGTTEKHLECRANACVQVDGAGANKHGCTQPGSPCTTEPSTGALDNTWLVAALSLGLVLSGIFAPRLNLVQAFRTQIIQRFERKILRN